MPCEPDVGQGSGKDGQWNCFPFIWHLISGIRDPFGSPARDWEVESRWILMGPPNPSLGGDPQKGWDFCLGLKP